METGKEPKNKDIMDSFKSDLKEAARLIACDDHVAASDLLLNAGHSLVRNLDIDISSNK